jgi:hypothetical protein
MADAIPDRIQRALARAAEAIPQAETEADRQRRRLESAPDDLLRVVLHDRGEPHVARVIALNTLAFRLRREPTLTDLLLPLFDDPDVELARAAIQQAPPFDPRMTERLRALLDDPRPSHWSAAATALARRKDPAVVSRLMAWFRRGDQAHRNVAFSNLSWVLDPEDHLALLLRAWEVGGHDDDDRAMLAAGLLSLGEALGFPFLEGLALRAEGHLATHAAAAIYDHNHARGLELMLHVLDHAATDETQWSMVMRIATRARRPFALTAAGLVEARDWIEQQRRALGLGAPDELV